MKILKKYYYKKNFRVCGTNDQEKPTNLESFENEISIFFRSSLKDSGRGLNCSYRVIEKELKPAKLYNGEGMYKKFRAGSCASVLTFGSISILET